MTWLLRLLWLVLLLEGEGDLQDDDDPSDEGDQDEEDPEPPTDEEMTKNPRIKELSHEAGRWRKKLRAAEERIAELETNSLAPALRTSRVEAAFWRALVVGSHRIADQESALDLFTARGFSDLVKVGTAKDDHDVKGLDEAMEKLIARYPWLADDAPSDDDVELPSRRTASPPRKQKDTQAQPSRGQLKERMPALRRHGR